MSPPSPASQAALHEFCKKAEIASVTPSDTTTRAIEKLQNITIQLRSEIRDIWEDTCYGKPTEEQSALATHYQYLLDNATKWLEYLLAHQRRMMAC